MKHLRNHALNQYTTFKLGGVADNVYFPANTKELKELLSAFSPGEYFLLGNGSNVLVASRRIRKPVIITHEMDPEIAIDATTGVVDAGAGADIRKLINRCTRAGLRAPVELLTIPATLGGAIFMNAGRTSLRTTISDDLLSVTAFDGTKQITLTRDQCEFGHRTSIFHKRRDLTILSAKLQYDQMSATTLSEQRKHSITAAKGKAYRSHASAGSVFKQYDHRLLSAFAGRGFTQTAFAEKTLNCIVNYGKAKPWQVKALIAAAVVVHRLRRKNISLEIEIW